MTGTPLGLPPATYVPPASDAPPAPATDGPAPAAAVRRPPKMTLNQAPGAGLPTPGPRDATPRKHRLGPIRLGGGADSAAVTGYVPHAVSGRTWEQVPERLRAEVLERAAVHNVRGTLAEDAVRKALSQALEDEMEVEAEFDWGVARMIVSAFPAPFRDVDHRPSTDILVIAAVVERLCRAELTQPGAGSGHRQYFEAFGLSERTLDAVSAAYRSRLEAMRLLLPPEPEDEAPEQPSRAMFGMDDDYAGLMQP